MPHLQFVYEYSQRLTSDTFCGANDTVTDVEEVPRLGEAGGIEVDSPPSYGMMSRMDLLAQIARSC